MFGAFLTISRLDRTFSGSKLPNRPSCLVPSYCEALAALITGFLLLSGAVVCVSADHSGCE